MNPFERRKEIRLDAKLDPTGSFRDRPLEDLVQACGYIPTFLTHRHEDERAQACFDRCYTHGGGWQSFNEGWTVDDDGVLRYPEDPPFVPYVKITLPDVKQTVFIYGHGMVMIREEDMTYDIARLD